MCLKKRHIYFVLSIAWIFLLVSQSSAQINSAARYEINAKRIGVSPGDKDALPRSREFIRLDSTYYVGWFYEGMYKYSRSADYLGYTYAIVPMEKALDLLEKDYGNNMMHVYSSIYYYQQNIQLFDDFHQICYVLERCYNNTEHPEKTMALLDRIDRFHLQKDFISTFSDRAWIYHRNRFFDSSKYPFLKNSLAENEAMAFQCCYLQIEKIKKNESLNAMWYGPGQEQQDLLTVYHYLALLHNYNQHYDSAEYYYRLLIDGGRISWGNYANMKHETGNFSEAKFYYQKEYYHDAFALSEPDYYLPCLLVYSAQTKEAIRMCREKISQVGSTPGFGWYNIALARSYLYDGQLDSCDFFLNKASNFKEVHINTTLTQSQYEFTINLLKLQLLDKREDLIRFENSGWWYSLTDLYRMLSVKVEKMLLEYALANALAYNPERKRIVYDLFCAETTVTFDESFYLLKQFNPTYFERMYVNYYANDDRLRVSRYFKLFIAKFAADNGEEEKARGLCRDLLDEAEKHSGKASGSNNAFEYENEKLFLARVYELLIATTDDDAERSHYQDRFFSEFPQLAPFSGEEFRLHLRTFGIEDGEVKAALDELKDCNIDFTEEAGAPQASIAFSKRDKTYEAIVNVVGADGKVIVKDERLLFKPGSGVGKELALRLFGKGGALAFEPEQPQPMASAKK